MIDISDVIKMKKRSGPSTEPWGTPVGRCCEFRHDYLKKLDGILRMRCKRHWC